LEPDEFRQFVSPQPAALIARASANDERVLALPQWSRQLRVQLSFRESFSCTHLALTSGRFM
jgi:hypothetical protein